MSLLRACIIDLIAGLQNRGYVLDFRLHTNQLICVQHQLAFSIDEVEIHDIHFFPGIRQMVSDLFVLAVEDPGTGYKGIVLVRRNSKHDNYLAGLIRNWAVEDPVLSYC